MAPLGNTNSRICFFHYLDRRLLDAGTSIIWSILPNLYINFTSHSLMKDSLLDCLWWPIRWLSQRTSWPCSQILGWHCSGGISSCVLFFLCVDGLHGIFLKDSKHHGRRPAFGGHSTVTVDLVSAFFGGLCVDDVRWAGYHGVGPEFCKKKKH